MKTYYKEKKSKKIQQKIWSKFQNEIPRVTRIQK